MTTQHPEALRLAEELDDGYPLTGDAISAAAELRRQHARIAELESQLAQRFDAADMATAAAQGFRDGAAKEQQAGAFQAALDIRTAQGWKLGGDKAPVLYTDEINGQQVCRDDVWLCTTDAFTHPSPPEGMVGGWTKASQQLPPCRDDQLYIGVNTAGFVGVFNAVTDIAGDVHCHYETAEECIDVMSGLDLWRPFNPPTSSADRSKEQP